MSLPSRLIVSFVLLCAGASDLLAQIMSVQGVDMVARLTGPGSINNTPLVSIGGTDLGHMVTHKNKTYFLFGDTFSSETSNPGTLWRWNTMAWTTDIKASDGILFDGWILDGYGRARQVMYSGYMNPVTEIPTGAISIGNRIYTWFMSVNWWGPAGQWTINYAGLAYTESGGQSFTVVNGFRLPSSTNFGMVAASVRWDVLPGTDRYVYVWGTPSGRMGGVKLARVLPEQIENPASYQYYASGTTTPVWVSSEASAAQIVAPTVGEMSVMYNRAARRWIMLYFNHNKNRIELRQASRPWGPWSTAITVVSGSAYPGLYGSYMNPWYIENQGQVVYFTMSLWNPYDVYLMRARFNIDNIPAPADLNMDGHVDSTDFDLFSACYNGPVNYVDGLCLIADFNSDHYVDSTDFDTFSACYNGPVNPSGCG